MARIPIITYKNSVLASLTSILGTALSFTGFIILVEIWKVGIILLPVGIGLMILAYHISKNKNFKHWVAHLEKEGIIDKLATSDELCMRMYIANPCKRTLNFIKKHNAAIALTISNDLKNQKKKKRLK